MNTLFRWFVVVSIIVTFAISAAWAGQVTGLKHFNPGDDALSGDINHNFETAVKEAVDDNDLRINANTTNKQNRVTGTCPAGQSIRAIAADGTVTCEIENVDIAGNIAGVDWVENGDSVLISTDETTSNVDSVTLTAPTSGFAIVTASGNIYWQINSQNFGTIRVKVSTTNNDMNIEPGNLFISQSFPSLDWPDIPYSVSKVFPVTSGTNTFYLNMFHSTVNGTAIGYDTTLIAIFVPNRF